MNTAEREKIINKIDKQFTKNRLTFMDNGYRAHYLARHSYGASPEKQIQMGQDTRRNNRHFSAGFMPDNHLDLIIANVSIPETPKILSSMMDKAYQNLSKNNSDKEIAEMLKFTSNVVYGYNSDDAYSQPLNTAPYEDFVNGLKNGGNIESCAEHVPNPIATTQSLLSLGLSKEEYFTEVVKVLADTDNDRKPVADDKKSALSKIIKYAPKSIQPILSDDKNMNKIINQLC